MTQTASALIVIVNPERGGFDSEHHSVQVTMNGADWEKLGRPVALSVSARESHDAH